MLRNSIFVLWFLVVIACENDSTIVSDYTDVPQAEENEKYSGGIGATIFNESEEAFGFSVPALSEQEQYDFAVGNSFFRQTWVTAPASASARDGLGPFFNATSCASCHFKDGRGRAPLFEGELGTGLLLRLNIPDQDVHGGFQGDPIYGGQLQDVALEGVKNEGSYSIEYTAIVETYSDGSKVTLRKPKYSIKNLNYGALASNVQVSPRVANQMYGMGLLEAISENLILANQDNNDLNGDGISGKANYVYDVETNSKKLGRFGWKANQPTVKQQVSGAFLGDMGITSGLFPMNNYPFGFDASVTPTGGEPEIENVNLNKVVLYSRTLAVPGRRNHADIEVLKGKELFNAIGCVQCHKPKFETSSNYPIAALRNLTIRPYTDLLLHDMGEGLADNSSDFLANGNEWRTPPLWGIGLIKTVNKHINLLHDGRARNMEEAVLWHGGEAVKSKQKFKELTKLQRDYLLKFLNSL